MKNKLLEELTIWRELNESRAHEIFAFIVTIIFLFFVMTNCTGCSGKLARNRHTDKNLRVMIDPDSIHEGQYVRIQNALIGSEKFVVVDRNSGFRAIKKEQEMLHRLNTDRFEDKEKWALWGKLYGVGGIVIAQIQCQLKDPFIGSKYVKCYQFISIMDANTGELIASAENQEDAPEINIAPSWDDVVQKLCDAYPTHFERNKDHEVLHDYRSIAQVHAEKQKRELANEQIDAAGGKISEKAERELNNTLPEVVNPEPAKPVSELSPSEIDAKLDVPKLKQPTLLGE